ncbi:MAG: ABC-2 type transport system ATP-binding protein [Rhodothermales bacterium]|jgi:ABC-2 type transport system ATP-binding protein
MGNMIRTEALTKSYGEGRGIHDLTLDVPANSIFGYIGPNGSGKSTTIKCLCGLLAPNSGRAWIGDKEVLPGNIHDIKRVIGYLPDDFGVYDQITVWEYLDFFGAAYKIPHAERRKRIDEVLELTHAAKFADYLVNSLSRGMHQKIGIAKTMLHDPDLLILDEPANGLDPHARIEMRETILRLKSIGKTIMLSSHILPELGAICDRVAILEKGKLLKQGTVKEITQSLQEHIALVIMVTSDLEKAVKSVKAHKTVRKVVASGNELRLEFVGKREEIADLNEHLVRNKVRVISLAEAEVDLENVFLAVTGKN